jgi:hypothetical protein
VLGTPIFPDGVALFEKKLIVLLVALASGQVQAHIASCPQRLRVMDQRGELVDAHLFIGLPEKKSELKRPVKHRQWVLAKLHQRAHAKGEDLYLQCRYKGMKASVTMPVPPVAKACIISEGASGETRIKCE